MPKRFYGVDQMGGTANQKRVLVIGADGLRPDVLEAGDMPTYRELMATGTVYTGFRSTFPSQTRVNMTTLATGNLPGRHGIVNNQLCVRTSRGLQVINTGDASQLRSLESHFGERPVLTPTLGDRLHAAGSRLSVVAASSPGASYLWNPNHICNVLNARTDNGNPMLALAHARLGPPDPEAGRTKYNLCKWATDAMIEAISTDRESRVFTLWLTEPDSSQHYYGLGSPQAEESLRVVDDCVARVLEALHRSGRADEFEILLVSDHGHSTVVSKGELAKHVAQASNELSITGFVAVGDFVYSEGAEWNETALATLIDWLAGQPWCDLVFANGQVTQPHEATVPLKLAIGEVTHTRAPLLAVSPTWDDQANEFGVPGRTLTLTSAPGLMSSHGTTSPFDMRPICCGVGPSFEAGASVAVPCSTVDIAPTVWELLGFDEPSNVYGFDGGSLLHRASETYELVRVTSQDGKRAVEIARVGDRSYMLESVGRL